jgi:hypothetical protein
MIIIIQIFIICVPSQQLQYQLQTEHSVDTSNHIKDKQHKDTRQITGKHWKKKTHQYRKSEYTKIKLKRNAQRT